MRSSPLGNGFVDVTESGNEQSACEIIDWNIGDSGRFMKVYDCVFLKIFRNGRKRFTVQKTSCPFKLGNDVLLDFCICCNINLPRISSNTFSDFILQIVFQFRITTEAEFTAET